MKNILVGVLVLFSLVSFSREKNNNYSFSKEKQFKKAFAINKDASIDIVNKYGDVTIDNWEKDSISIFVEIKSQGDKLDKVMERLNEVTIDFSGSKSYVSAQTQWYSSGFIKRSLDDIKLGVNGSNKLEINYKIMMPKSCKLTIVNSFGDVNMDDADGQLQAEISYGDFRADNLKNVRHITVKYGDANIEEIEKGSINMSYGDIEIEEANDIDVSSAFGKISIEEVENIQIDSKNDEIDIEEVGNIEGVLTFSECKIEKLNNTAELDSKFGRVKIKEVNNSFERIDLSGYHTNYKIYTDSNLKTGFKVVLENGKEFEHEGDIKVTDNASMDRVEKYTGSINGGTDIKIRIQTKMGKVSLED